MDLKSLSYEELLSLEKEKQFNILTAECAENHQLWKREIAIARDGLSKVADEIIRRETFITPDILKEKGVSETLIEEFKVLFEGGATLKYIEKQWRLAHPSYVKIINEIVGGCNEKK